MRLPASLVPVLSTRPLLCLRRCRTFPSLHSVPLLGAHLPRRCLQPVAYLSRTCRVTGASLSPFCRKNPKMADDTVNFVGNGGSRIMRDPQPAYPNR